MKIWLKIAAGILGGLAIIASLGGINKRREEETTVLNSNELPDDILDGNNQIQPRQRRGAIMRRETEQNVRNLQEGLSRASNILGHISIICNSIVRMFCEDPCIRITPTTYIM